MKVLSKWELPRVEIVRGKLSGKNCLGRSCPRDIIQVGLSEKELSSHKVAIEVKNPGQG